jgi:hypothetical protein
MSDQILDANFSCNKIVSTALTQVLQFVRSLSQEKWSCYLFEWLNQRNKKTGIRAPTLVMLQRLSDEPLEQ